MGKDQDFAIELVGSDELDTGHILYRVLFDHHNVFPDCKHGDWDLYFLFNGEFYFCNKLL